MLSFRDDALSQTAKFLIMVIFELGSGNVDGALMVGHHEGDEIRSTSPVGSATLLMFKLILLMARSLSTLLSAVTWRTWV